MQDTTQATQPAGFDLAEPKTRFIAVFGFATLLLLAAIILGLQAYVDRVKEHEIFVKVLEPVSADLTALRSREDIQLDTYQYLDRGKGAVRLPIRRAMDLLAQEYAEGKLFYPARPVPVKPAQEAAK